MRFIDKTALQLQQTWLQKANTLMQKLESLYTSNAVEFVEEKKKIFDGAFWREVKKELLSLSYHKCWYCESVIDREFGAVDHFRPKGKILDDDQHQGYWWLVLEPENFRLSCTICNSPSSTSFGTRGKHNWFPLVDSSQRAYEPNHKLRSERPVLLDPTEQDDVGFIVYELDGKPYPAHSGDAEKRQRAEESIRLYYLDKPETCERRRQLLDALNKVLKSITTYEALLPKAPPEQKQELESRLEELRSVVEERVKPQAEFSAAAWNLLTNRRGHSSWLDGFLKASGF